jgi:hypothetical protein
MLMPSEIPGGIRRVTASAPVFTPVQLQRLTALVLGGADATAV